MSRPHLSQDELFARMRELGFPMKNGTVLLGARFGPSREFHAEYIEWCKKTGVKKILPHDEFLSKMIKQGYVIVDSIEQEDGAWDHFIAMPGKEKP